MCGVGRWGSEAHALEQQGGGAAGVVDGRWLRFSDNIRGRLPVKNQLFVVDFSFFAEKEKPTYSHISL